jgi:HEPN domain-containing protein
VPILVNYLNSSRRHFEDASLLHKNGRIPNAGHLMGMSAECGIKALLIGLGHPTDPNDGSIDRSLNFRIYSDPFEIGGKEIGLKRWPKKPIAPNG